VRRFFLDANVIFTAAHNPNGNGRALFRLAAEQQLELIVSRYALEEAARNIAVPSKCRWRAAEAHFRPYLRRGFR